MLFLTSIKLRIGLNLAIKFNTHLGLHIDNNLDNKEKAKLFVNGNLKSKHTYCDYER